MRAAGSHTRVAPEEVRTSTRVVSSNVRQPLGSVSANKRAVFGSARLADTMPAERIKSRRFMGYPFNSLKSIREAPQEMADRLC